MTPRDRLARLHFVNTLFHALTGRDLYLAAQVLEAIEAAAAEGASGAVSSGDLSERLRELYDRLIGGTPDAAFAFCDGAADEAAGPLWVRAELLSAVRHSAPYRQATIMVANLPGGETAPARRRNTRAAERRARDRADTIAQLRDLAARRANPHSLLTLLFI